MANASSRPYAGWLRTKVRHVRLLKLKLFYMYYFIPLSSIHAIMQFESLFSFFLLGPKRTKKSRPGRYTGRPGQRNDEQLFFSRFNSGTLMAVLNLRLRTKNKGCHLLSKVDFKRRMNLFPISFGEGEGVRSREVREPRTSLHGWGTLMAVLNLRLRTINKGCHLLSKVDFKRRMNLFPSPLERG